MIYRSNGTMIQFYSFAKMLAVPGSDQLTLMIWLRYRLTQDQSMNGVFTYMETPYSYPNVW